MVISRQARFVHAARGAARAWVAVVLATAVAVTAAPVPQAAAAPVHLATTPAEWPAGPPKLVVSGNVPPSIIVPKAGMSGDGIFVSVSGPGGYSSGKPFFKHEGTSYSRVGCVRSPGESIWRTSAFSDYGDEPPSVSGAHSTFFLRAARTCSGSQTAVAIYGEFAWGEAGARHAEKHFNVDLYLPGHPGYDSVVATHPFDGSAIPLSESIGGPNPSQECNGRCHGDPINSLTGELWENSLDLSVTTSGIPLAWSRVFSSTRDGVNGPVGRGWTFGYDMRLEPINSGALETATAVRVVQENGSHVSFEHKTESKREFFGPPRVLARLTVAPDGNFHFTRRGRQIFVFSSAGQLIEIRDPNGNSAALTYEGGRLLSVATAEARLDIRWEGDRITRVQDHAGRTVAYSYTASGELASVDLPDGSRKGYEHDSQGQLVAFVHPDGGRTSTVYDSLGRVVRQIDPIGRELRLDYFTPDEYWGPPQPTPPSSAVMADSRPHVTRITRPDGSVTLEEHHGGRVVAETFAAGTAHEARYTYVYGATEQAVQMHDPLGRTWRWEYSFLGKPVSATDPLGRTSKTTYDAFGNPLTHTDPVGDEWTYSYDSRGNPRTVKDPTGATTTFTVNANGTIASTKDPLGRVTTYTYDARGFLATARGADGAVVAHTHDSLGRLTSTTDPRGTATGAPAGGFASTFVYDAAGRRLTATDPLGAVVAAAYDAAGRPTSVTDPSGATMNTEYDLAGQVSAVVDAAGERTTFAYDDAGRVTTVTDPTGATTTTTYDVLGRATTVTDAIGRVTRNEHDAGGRITATVNPSGARTTYVYDDADQLLTVTDPLGGVTMTSYDQAGRPATVTDADGRAVTTTYDRAGRPVKALRADGSDLQWVYDATGNLTSTVDASGARTTYTYDAAGRRATATDTAGRTTRFGYDPAGLLTTLTQADGAVTTYTYDAAGRRTGTDYSDATVDVSTVYDVAGRPASVTDGTGTTTYAYDVLGRVLEVANGATSVGYAWDALGRLTELTYPSGQAVQREYDAVGQLTTVTDWADREYTYTYDADGLTEQIAYPNGVTTGFDRDGNGQTLAVTTQGNGIDLLELAYGYTDAGLLADQGTTRSTQSRAPPATPSTSSTYAWDDLARISQITGDHAGTFDFDAAGSVTALADGRALTYDTARQLTALVTPAATPDAVPVTTGYTYDGRGNRATATTDTGPAAGTVTHAYDQANRLTSITGADTSTTTYTYAATGLRATATTDTTTEQYTWDTLAGIPLLLTDATFAYVYGNGSVPLAQVDLTDGGTDYLHTDTLGSVRSTTDATGAVTSDADYDTYGRPEAPTSDPTAKVTRFGYAGEYTDPTGYLYLRARYYDPEAAQFLTRDPLEATTGNPYGYTDGNPLQYTDPLGLDWLQNVSDFSAGFGDTVTFGGTQQIRRLINYSLNGAMDDMVDNCSTSYTWGGYTGTAASLTLGVAGLIKMGAALVGRMAYATQMANGTLTARFAAQGISATGAGAGGAVRAYEVGTFNALRSRSAIGDGLDLHHVPQTRPASQVVPGYTRGDAPAIALPRTEHARIPKGPYSGTPEELLARDVSNLRTYTGSPESSIDELVDLIKRTYPHSYGSG